MATLYEMTQQVKELYDLLQSDEIDSETFADTFEAMSADKIEGYCQIIRQLSADEEMFKSEIDRLSKRKKVCENAQARLTEDDFGSLTDEQSEYYLEMFHCPEIIMRTGNGFVALKIEE